MSTEHIKHSFFKRSLLVVMSLLYLFSPLYSELNLLLHKISHQFIIEEHHIEVSNENEHHNHTDHHEHTFLVSNHSEEAVDHHIIDEIDDHTHELISLFNSFFKYDASKDKKENHFFENKIDKHILSRDTNLPHSFLAFKDKKLWICFSIAESPEPDITIPPPQNNLT